MIPNKLPKTNVIPGKQTRQNTWKAAMNVFAEKNGYELNINALYVAHFNYIPNTIEVVGIDIEKAHTWFLNQFEEAVQNCYFRKVHLLSRLNARRLNSRYEGDKSLSTNNSKLLTAERAEKRRELASSSSNSTHKHINT